MTNIENLLRENGPLLSGELIELIRKKEFGISDEAIRKRISRLQRPIYKYFGYYADKQKLFYLEEQFHTPQFREALLLSFEKKAKRFDSVIKSIQFHDGFLQKDQLPAYSFSPVEKLIGHKQFSTVLSELERLKIVFKQDEYYSLGGSINQSDFTNYKAVEMAKRFTLSHFMEWARNLGLTSYDKGTYFSNFAKFQWAFTCPSYINSLTSFKGEKKIPAFIIADILIGRQIQLKDVEFFIKKIQICNAQIRLSKFLPFFLFEDASQDAFNKLKSAGIIVGNLSKLFGNEYPDLLKDLVNTVKNAGAILKANPEQYFEFIKKINKLIDGKTNNLRGDLFELAVGFFHSNKCQSIDIGKLIRFEGEYREVDVFAVYDDKIVISECKGYKSKVTGVEIETWLSSKILFIRNAILQQEAYSSKNLTFEFWATGGYSDEALVKLKKAEKTTKYKVVYFGEKEILQKANQMKSSKFINIIKQYFIGEEF